jgi:hypothetical protein
LNWAQDPFRPGYIISLVRACEAHHENATRGRALQTDGLVEVEEHSLEEEAAHPHEPLLSPVMGWATRSSSSRGGGSKAPLPRPQSGSQGGGRDKASNELLAWDSRPLSAQARSKPSSRLAAGKAAPPRE